MKMIVHFIVTICVCLISFYHISYSQNSGNRVFESSYHVNKKSIMINQTNLSVYKYSTIYSCLVINENTIAVLGRKDDAIIELSLIDTNAGISKLVGQYSKELAWSLYDSIFYAFFISKEQSSVPYFAVVYQEGVISRFTDETTTYLDVFYLNSDNEYSLAKKVELAIRNIDLMDREDSGNMDDYLFCAANNPQGEMVGPATVTDYEITFSDQNEDGFLDIIINKKIKYSKKVGDYMNSGEAFSTTEEGNYVLRYNSAKNAFNDLVKIE